MEKHCSISIYGFLYLYLKNNNKEEKEKIHANFRIVIIFKGGTD